MSDDWSLKLVRIDEERRRRSEFLQAFRDAGSARGAMKKLGVSKSTFYRVLANANLSQLKQLLDIRVLVVDDEAFKRHEIQQSLLEQGLIATAVGSGSEALELFTNRSFSCVLTDQRMRHATDGMDGLRLAEELLKDHPKLPVVMLTACATVPLARQAFKRGFADVIEYQTVEWSALAEQVRELSVAYDASRA